MPTKSSAVGSGTNRAITGIITVDVPNPVAVPIPEATSVNRQSRITCVMRFFPEFIGQLPGGARRSRSEPKMPPCRQSDKYHTHGLIETAAFIWFPKAFQRQLNANFRIHLQAVVYILLNHTIKSQTSKISNDTKVTGIPTAACWENVILILKSEACSTTIRLAMLPSKNRLPAKVLDTASVYH